MSEPEREPFAWYVRWDEDDRFIHQGHEAAHIKLPSAAEYAEKRKHDEAERAWVRTMENGDG